MSRGMDSSGRSRRSSRNVPSSLASLVDTVDSPKKGRRLTNPELQGQELASKMLSALKLAYDQDGSVNPEGAAVVMETYVNSTRQLSPSPYAAASRRSSVSSNVPSSPITPKLKSQGGNKSCRIYDMDAIKAPGVIYKAISIAPRMSARELIQETLDKVGSAANPDKFEVRYSPDPDAIEDPKKRKKIAEPPKLLKPEDCPSLVVEWYTDIPRRFEIHMRSSDPEKLEKKWADYWHAPSSFTKKAHGQSMRRSSKSESVRRRSSSSSQSQRRRSSSRAPPTPEAVRRASKKLLDAL